MKRATLIVILLAIVGIVSWRWEISRPGHEPPAAPQASFPAATGGKKLEAAATAAGLGTAAPATPPAAGAAVATPRQATASSRAAELLRLTYATAWGGVQPAGLAEFRDWAVRYVRAGTAAERAALEPTGVALARARRSAMRALIESDPEKALAVTVPAEIRSSLPADVVAELETRFAVTGNLSVMAVDYGAAELARRQKAGLTTEPFQRFVELDGQKVAASVYGRRLGETTKRGIPLHGVVLDGRAALHAGAMRVLEPGETDPAAASGGVSADVGGQLQPFATAAELLQAEARFEASEKGLGPVPLPIPGGTTGALKPAPAAIPVVAPQPTTAWTTGNKKVLVIRVDFSDLAGDPRDGGGTTFTAAAAQTLADTQVKPYYAQSSYGLTSLTNTVTTQLYRLPQTAATYATLKDTHGNDLGNDQLHSDARAAAAANYTLSNYDRIVVLFSYFPTIANSQITYGGLAEIGGPNVWVNGEFDFRVVAHELGHTYGLFHGNLWQVADGNPISPSGTSVEYGDDFETMGANYANSQGTDFNPWFKNLLGWAADSQVQTVTASGTYRVNRFDNTTGTGTLGLKVVKDATRTYWVGVRRRFTANASMQHGAYIIWGASTNQASQLLDLTTPGTSDQDAALAVGATLVDAAANLSIKTLAEGGTAPNEYLDVQVNIGNVNAAPVVVTPPANLSVAAGTAATLSVFATGTPAPTYQWRKGGVNIGGATSASLAFASVQAADAGSYDVVLTNSLGTVTSSAALLTVNAAGGAAPSNDNFAGAWVLPGYNGVAAATNVGATSETGEPTHVTAGGKASSVWFRWTPTATGTVQFDTIGSSIDTVLAVYTGGTVSALTQLAQDDDSGGGTASKLVLAVTAGTTYALAVGSHDGVTRGNLTFNYALAAPPTITTQPTGQSGVLGGTASFTVVATGGTLAYQWYRGGVALTGATAATLSLSGLQAADFASYYVIVTNGNGSVTSNTVSLISAGVAPTITTQPTGQLAAVGGSATFTVVAIGPPAPTYQWRKNGTAIAGATSATLTLANVPSGAAGSYDVVVTNLAGSVTSNPATLTIIGADAFASRVVLSGSSAGVTATNTGASKETGEPNHAGNAGGRSVWWSWTAPFSGQVTIDTIGSDFDTLLGVYTGSSVSALTTIASDNNSGTSAGASKLAFNAIAGTTYQIAVDGAGGASGNIVLSVAYSYTFSTLAGNVGYGSSDGTGSAARFYYPQSVAVDASGNAYVADTSNHTIRKITAGGVVTTFAGVPGIFGSADGTGGAARFNYPTGVAVDGSGNVFVADSRNYTIRKITSSGVVTTFAGLAGNVGNADGTGSGARFNFPYGVAVDGSGNVYVADTSNQTIRKITAAGVVTTFAGLAGNFGSADGTGSSARFNGPQGIAVDASGNVFVADTSNSTIREITSGGITTTVAGLAGNIGSVNGTGSAARFYYPSGVAVDSSGNLFVADPNNRTIRKITSSGVVTTFAGSTNVAGSTDGVGSAVAFFAPTGVAVDGGGNVFVADTNNHTIRKIGAGGIVTTLAGSAASGSVDGSGAGARFNGPEGIAVDGNGNVFVADTGNQTIRKIATGGIVTTFAGTAGVVGTADGTGNAARFNYPTGIAVDISGNMFVADASNQTIRKITTGGVVTTFAGTAGIAGFADGTGNAARFNFPRGIAVDASGNVFVADTANETIRKITAGGVVTTVAGAVGLSGTADGSGTVARFQGPSGIAVDSTGNIFVADSINSTIRKITAGGVVSTLAGGGVGLTDGVGSAARFGFPFGLAVDGSGSVFVADPYDYAIRKVTPSGVVTTFVGVAGYSGSADGTGNAVRFYNPYSIATDGSGNVFVTDTFNNTIRKGVPSYATTPTITAQPAIQAVVVGGTATVSVAVSSNSAVTYQWQFNGGAISDGAKYSGTTTATLTVSNLQPVDAGSYSVVVTNGYGSTTSAGATLAFRGQGTTGQQFVAVGQGGTLLTSPDAATWTSRSSGTNKRLRAATASANLFVVVGENGTVLTSADGMTWTARTSGATQTLRGVATGPTQFIAVGGDTAPLLLSSGDGVTWSLVATPALGTLRGVACGNGLFVAVGQSGTIISSPDGLAWTTRSVGTSERLDGVVWTGTQFVVVGQTGRVLTSPDAITWNVSTSNAPSWLEGLTWSNTGYVVVGASGQIATSPDGAFWTSVASGTANTIHGIAWSGASFTPTGNPVTLLGNLAQIPAIATQPASALVGVGGTASFAIAASGSGTLTYQWRYNGATIADGSKYSGTTTANLTVANLQAGDTGNYSVVVTNSFGSRISTGATLAVRGAGTTGQQFVAVGQNGTLLTSPDGATWTSRSSGTTKRLRAATASGNLFVVVGESGTVLTSADGVTWTARTSGVTQTLRGVAAGPAQFVAVGGDTAPLFRYSADGVTWSPVTTPALGTLRGVAFGSGMFLAVGQSGTILSSPDGLVWTSRSAGSSERLDGVVWTGTQFVVISQTGRVLTSPDAVTWSATASNAPSWLEGLTWSNAGYLVVGAGGQIATSPDGAFWTSVASGTANTIHGVTWSGGAFTPAGNPVTLLGNLAQMPAIGTPPASTLVGVGGTASFGVGASGNGTLTYQWRYNGAAIADGAKYSGTTTATLTVANLQAGDAGSYSVVVANGFGSRVSPGATLVLRGLGTTGQQFVAVGQNGTLLTSPDGATWTSRSSGTTKRLRAVTASGNLFVVVGESGTVLTSADGVTWIARTSGVTQTLRGVAAGPAQFVAVGGDTVPLFRYSADGVTWSPVTTPALGTLRGVAVGNGMFLAVGQSGAILSSPDGLVWTSRSAGSSERLDGVVWTGTQFVVISQTGRVLTSPDAIAWSATASNAPAWLEGLTWSNTNYVVVGANGQMATSLDGAFWTVVSSGTTNTLHGVAWSGGSFTPVGNPVTLLGNLAQIPSIAAQPVSTVANGGATVSFSVGASGAGPFSYQWRLNGVVLSDSGKYSGTGTAALTVANLVGSDAGSYAVVVRNSAGSVTSSAATLTVNLAPPSFTSASSANFATGQVASFAVTGTGLPAPTYSVVGGNFPSWARLDAITGVISGSPPNAAHAPFTFTIQASNGVGTPVQQSFMLTVTPPVGALYAFTTIAGAAQIGSADGSGAVARFNGPAGVAMDSAGNLYVADTNNNTIRKISPTGVVSTLAGVAGTPGNTDGISSAARFNGPAGVAVDIAGNVYVADTQNSTIRKISPAGMVTTVAGLAGNRGSADGTGSDARFFNPPAVAIDSAGNIYVADANIHAIRKVTPAGVVTTLAGSAGNFGSADGTGNAARFDFPSGVAVDSANNVYVADSANDTIRKITPAGVVTTLAGLAGSGGSADGQGSAAQFTFPSGLALDGANNLYVADNGSSRIRRITPGGLVTTVAGVAGHPGEVDGPAATAQFWFPNGVAVGSDGSVYVADTGNSNIRKISPGAVVSTVAGGTARGGSVNGTGAAARFNAPASVMLDSVGNIYVADANNNTIRALTPAGVVTTLAGQPGTAGSADGTFANARFFGPSCLAMASDRIYVVDNGNNAVRELFGFGGTATLAGLAGSSGSVDGTGNAARFNAPIGAVVDGSDNVYISDMSNHIIRKVTPAGVVTTLAGLAGSSGSVDGTGSAARFSYPRGLAIDPAGNIYVADTGNATVRKIAPGGTVTTVAGLAGTRDTSDGTGNAARFLTPTGLARDGAGNLYVTDGNRIREVTPGGVVTTLGGAIGIAGSADGEGSAARFNGCAGIAVDGAGILYVADASNNTIRKGWIEAAPAIASQPTAQSVMLGGTAVFSVTATADFPTYQWRKNGVILGNGGNIAGADTASLTIGNALATDAGNYSVDVTNGVGSVSSSAATFVVGVAPSISAPPTGATVIAGQAVSFAVGVSGTGPFTYQWRRNGFDLAGETSSTLAIGSVDFTGGGSISVVVNSVWGTAISQPVTLTVNPVTPTIISPATAVGVVGRPFIYQVNASTTQATYTATGLAGSGLTLDPATGAIAGVPTATGTLTVAVTATNATGHDTKTVTITIQAPPPAITSAASASGQVGTAFNFPVLASNTPTAFSATGLPAGLTQNATTGVIAGVPTQAGSFLVTLTATNATGTVSSQLNLIVAPGTHPAPVYRGPTNPGGIQGAPFSFTPSFGTGNTGYALLTPPSNDPLFGLVGGLPAGLTLNALTGAITGTPTQVGTFWILLQATNATGSTPVLLALTINPPPNAPTITSASAAAATVGTPFSFTLTASPAATSYNASGLPAPLTLNATTGVIGGTPAAALTQPVYVSATNATGTGPTAVLQLTISPAATAPVITSVPVVSGTVNVPLSYTLTATNPPATFAITAGTLPAGLSLNATTGAIAGTPTAAGQHTVWIAATNAAGRGYSFALLFSLAPGAAVPVVIGNGTALGQVGQPFAYAIVATNHPTAFAATPLPAGLSLDATTGLISGLPADATATPLALSITATNASGTSDVKTLWLTIAPAPATPTITSALTSSGRVGVAYQYAITASATPTSYLALGLPDGLTLNPQTGAIAGTPTTAGTSAVTLRAANLAGLGAPATLSLAIGAASGAPAITSPASAAGQVGAPFTYTVTAAPGPIASYTLVTLPPSTLIQPGDLPQGLAFDTGTGVVSGQPITAGLFPLTFTATSAAGTSAPQAVLLNIAPADHTPVIVSPVYAVAQVGVSFSYQIAAVGTPAFPAAPFPAPFTLDAVNLPPGLAVNPATGLIQGSPTVAGTFTATLTGTNPAGSGPFRDLIVTVQSAAAAPVIASVPAAAGQVGVAFSYQITATNAPQSYEVLGTPAWMTVNNLTGAIAGTPTAPGALTVQLLASNAAGTSNPVTLTLLLAPVAGTPAITSSRFASGQVGTALSYQATASPAATAYTATGLPPGLALDSTTGAIAGIPTASGRFEVALSAANASGAGLPVTLVIVVQPSLQLVVPGP